MSLPIASEVWSANNPDLCGSTGAVMVKCTKINGKPFENIKVPQLILCWPPRKIRCLFFTHHSKMQREDWAKYIQNFAFKWCKYDRTLGNKNENAKYVSFWEKALFDLDWPKSRIWKKLRPILKKVY